MARLNLEVELRTQKLLAENRDRAAANRAGLVTRANDTQAATQQNNATTPVATEDPRGGVPTLSPTRRPGAKRRPQEGLRLFGLETPRRLVVPGSSESFSQSWTATYLDWTVVDSQNSFFYRTEERINSYEINSVFWQALMYEQRPNSQKLIPASTFSIEDHIFSLQWTLRHRSIPDFEPNYTGESFPSVYASPPALPFLLEDKSGSIHFPQTETIITADGDKVYLSTRVRETKPDIYVLRTQPFYVKSIYDSDAYDYPLVLFRQYDDVTRRVNTTRDEFVEFFESGGVNDIYHGLYWVFDLKAGTSQFRRTSLASNSFASFLDNLTPGDPMLSFWNQHKAAYSGTGESTIAFLFINDNRKSLATNSNVYYYGWPPSLTYSPTTGLTTIVTRLADVSGHHTFTYQGSKNLALWNYARFLLPQDYKIDQTTKQDFLDSGWKLVSTIPTTPENINQTFFASTRVP